MKAIDRTDVVIGGGLITMSSGVAALSVPWALIVLGGILFLLGVAGVLRRGGAR
jgi:hypothetical protein